MKHSIAFKFMITLLTALALVAAVAGAAGIVSIERAGLYINSLDELQDHEYDSISKSIATAYADLYAVEQLSELSYSMRKELYSNPSDRADAGHWKVMLRQGDEILVDPGDTSGYPVVREYKYTPLYPVVSNIHPSDIPDHTIPSQDPSAPSAPTPKDKNKEDVIPPEGYVDWDGKTVWTDGGLYTYYLYYYQAPEYTVTVYMHEEVLESSSLHLLTALYPFRNHCIGLLVICLILFAAGLVFLCWSSGRCKDGTIRPGGLNVLPLDIYALVTGVGIWLLSLLYQQLYAWTLDEGPHTGNLSLLGVNILAITLLSLGLITAFAAQVKMGGGYWWRHSVIGWCLTGIFRGLRFVGRSLRRLFLMLPVIWQWVLTTFLSALCLLICFLLAWNNGGAYLWLLALSIVACVAIVCYGGYAFGSLLIGVKKMSQGDLSYKVPTRFLFGSFRDFATQLNMLSETAMLAAQNHLRSERMKTELITNVSHDIKTPLTSIINFVDLLRQPHSPEQEKDYLDVLSRQSSRMKKLIDDLVELSKVNSGNITASITSMDATETVNQALGEFSDKLESMHLTPVFQAPEEPVYIAADGRLVWRVLSNLLSNAVKYAMPGTRLYIDLVRLEDKVLLSMKNVSREELHGNAGELMERFVRGDAARQTEGSGLGLNIAKSLMDIQQGQLQLLIDGDLFKVTLVFPSAGDRS